MSKATELAEAEAREAEAETPDEPAEPDADDQEQDEQAETDEHVEKRAEPSAEQQVKQLDRAVGNFERALRKLFDFDGELEPVPLEGALGFMVPGVAAMRTHEKFKRCDTCNGYGQVLTGSLAANEATANCPRCAGRGYLEKLDRLPPPPANVVAAAGNGEPAPADEYGVPSWMGNPQLRPASGG